MANTERSKANWFMAKKLLPRIHAKLGTEADCKHRALTALAKQTEIYCQRSKCGHKNAIPVPVVRAFKCEKCRKEISLTAKTYFHGVQKFKPRLIIMELQERGITLSANQLSKLIGVSTDTISKALKSIAIAALMEIETEAISIPTAFCTNAVGRRTNRTPSNEPPIAEEFDYQRQMQASSPDISKVTLPSFTKEEELVFTQLSKHPMSFDELFEATKLGASSLGASLMTLELKGCLERRVGDQFVIAENSQISITLYEYDSEHEKGIGQTLVNFIKDFFQSIGRKNLQLYSVLDWINNDTKRWTQGSLLKLCASSRQITYEEILEYVTPLAFFVVPKFNPPKKEELA